MLWRWCPSGKIWAQAGNKLPLVNMLILVTCPARKASSPFPPEFLQQLLFHDPQRPVVDVKLPRILPARRHMRIALRLHRSILRLTFIVEFLPPPAPVALEQRDRYAVNDRGVVRRELLPPGGRPGHAPLRPAIHDADAHPHPDLRRVRVVPSVP